MVILSIGLFLFFAFFFMYIVTDTNFKKTEIINSEENALTMKEAISKGYEYVNELSTDANLTMIMSADAKEKQTIHSGELGKRRIWNLEFNDTTKTGNDGTTTCYVIKITDNKVTDCKSTKATNNTKIENLTSTLILDSTDAVKIAKNQKLLNPGKDWATGYHFKMVYFPLDEKHKDQRLIIEVVGLSPNGNFAQVDIDGKSGNIVKAIERTHMDDNGNAVWKEF
jgi:hypothetical protein